MWSATRPTDEPKKLRLISTHAPRVECDPAVKIYYFACRFNPRTPYGVRQAEFKAFLRDLLVSTHAPHVECDSIDLLVLRHFLAEWTDYSASRTRAMKRQ